MPIFTPGVPAAQSRTTAQLSAAPQSIDIALGAAASFYDAADPTKRYVMSAAQTSFVRVDGGGNSTGGVLFTSAAIYLPVRSAIAKAIAGVSDVRLFGQGDSISAGTTLTIGSTHFLSRTAQRLAQKTGIPVGQAYINLASNTGIGTQLGDASVTRGAGWSAYGLYPLYTAAMISAPSSTVPAVDVAIAETIDSVNVVWLTGGGNTGPLVYSWDAVPFGSATTIANPGGSAAFTRTNILAPSRGVHTLHLWQAGSGFASYIYGVEPQDSQIRKIRACATGFPGKCAQDLSAQFVAGLSIPDGLTAMQADCLVIEIGTNDQLGLASSTSGAAWAAYLQNIVNQTKARGRSLSYVYVGPSNSSTSDAQINSVDSYNTTAVSFGQANGAAVYSVSNRWGAYAAANFAGYFSDGLHPSAVGSADMGIGLSEALA